MTDLEINKALALAIGWKADCVLPKASTSLTLAQCWVYTGFQWRIFSYKDWKVIGPIAERYNCFPYKWRDTNLWVTVDASEPYADTPQKAIALAVIQGVKK